MAKFLTWLLCLTLFAGAIVFTGIHAVTHSFDGSHFAIIIGCAILLAVIGSNEGD